MLLRSARLWEIRLVGLNVSPLCFATLFIFFVGTLGDTISAYESLWVRG